MDAAEHREAPGRERADGARVFRRRPGARGRAVHPQGGRDRGLDPFDPARSRPGGLLRKPVRGRGVLFARREGPVGNGPPSGGPHGLRGPVGARGVGVSRPRGAGIGGDRAAGDRRPPQVGSRVALRGGLGRSPARPRRAGPRASRRRPDRGRGAHRIAPGRGVLVRGGTGPPRPTARGGGARGAVPEAVGSRRVGRRRAVPPAAVEGGERAPVSRGRGARPARIPGLCARLGTRHGRDCVRGPPVAQAMNWFAIFLYLWAAGISGALTIVPPRDLGRRFFRFHAAVLLVLVTAATAAGRPLFSGPPGGTLGTFVDLLAWVLVADVVAISMLAFSRTRPVVALAFLLPVVAGAMFAATVAPSAAPGGPGSAALLTADFGSGGALMGSVLVAMNLGHSYLQNAALSFDHLARLAKLFLGSAIARSAVSLALLAPEAGRWWPQLLDTFDGMLIAVRVVGGLAGPIVLAAMVHSCARSRANQSATGILYAAVVFVLVGEAISMYLTLGRGIFA